MFIHSGEVSHAVKHLEYLSEAADPATNLPIRTTEEALRAAIAGETHEYTDMYPGMARTAEDEGFEEIAAWFRVKFFIFYCVAMSYSFNILSSSQRLWQRQKNLMLDASNPF